MQVNGAENEKSVDCLRDETNSPRLTSNVSRLTYIALAGLFTPTFHKLFTYGWKQADYTHGPLILIVFAWLLWKSRDFIELPGDDGLRPGYMVLLVFGLLLYVFGAVNRVIMFEAGSLIPLLLGVSGFLYGPLAVRKLFFPATYLIFLVPPPLFFIDFVTSPLKKLVAAASVPILSMMGYPVIRNGVLLYIGDYSIVIGDACSGLRSMVALLAVGALYAWPKHLSVVKKTMLFLSIIPIAIAANIVRLILLALITYYRGDSAGQKFFHDYSGFFLFLFSLMSLVVVDVMLERGKAVAVQA